MLLAWSTWMPHGHGGVEHWSEEMRVQTQVGMRWPMGASRVFPFLCLSLCNAAICLCHQFYILISFPYIFWEIEEEIQFVERSSIIPPYVCVKECVLPHKLSVSYECDNLSPSLCVHVSLPPVSRRLVRGSAPSMGAGGSHCQYKSLDLQIGFM